MNIFEQILIEKIEMFKMSFSNTAKKVFIDEEGKLIHPGEFGSYRENICKEFLRYIVPSRLDIGQGFLMIRQCFNMGTDFPNPPDTDQAIFNTIEVYAGQSRGQ